MVLVMLCILSKINVTKTGYLGIIQESHRSHSTHVWNLKKKNNKFFRAMIIAFANIIFWNLFITKHELDKVFFFLIKWVIRGLKTPEMWFLKRTPSPILNGLSLKPYSDSLAPLASHTLLQRHSCTFNSFSHNSARCKDQAMCSG